MSTLEQRAMDILHLLADPDRFKKRLGDLQSQIDQAQVVIELVGLAREIETIRTRVEKERREAEEARNAARAEVANILKDGHVQAEGIIEAASKRGVELTNAAEAKVQDANDRQAQGQEKLAEGQRKEAELNEFEQSLQTQSSALQQKEIELDELQQQLLKEKSELATVSEQIKAVTG